MLVRLIRAPVTTYNPHYIEPAADPDLWEIGKVYKGSKGLHYRAAPSAILFAGEIDDLLDADCFEPVDAEAKAFYGSSEYTGE